LDATNAVDARGVLLTSVGDDHHQILGDSLAQIAREKLGLARRGRPFYLGLLPAGIDALAAEVLAAAGAQAVDLSLGRGTVEAWDGRSARVRLWLPAGEAVVTLPQRGAMQAQMAALAWACWEDLARREGWPLGDAGRALRGVRAPCRYEGFGAAPELLLDTAHNTPALQQVLAQWSAERPRAERVLVFGVMRDKRIDAVLGEIAACAACVVLTAPCWERSLPPRDLAARLRAATPASGTPPLVLVVESVTAAMEEARRRAMAPTAGGRGQSVLVTGSNFLVAEVLDRIGVDDLVGPPHAPLWDAGSPLRERPQREQEVATP
jgi:dihydrofolate synthase/folylpolyglutamate synthase